jgi:beta-ribofuranosylaminobenzene 5'-phosphate synthase
MHIPNNTYAQVHHVTVSASARLHMGFYDLMAANRFGSLGLSIDAPLTKINIRKSENTLINANCSENIDKIVENIVNVLNLKNHFTLTVEQIIPIHAGLGSGTQMALAIGAGLNSLFGLNLSVPQIAKIAGRGKRSGIGVAAFQQGGFLVDAGKTDNQTPNVALQHTFPTDWRILLVQDSAHVGVHGGLELQAFEMLKLAQNHLHEMVFKHMVPALQRADLLAFGAYMQDLQAYNGDYFAPVQGGRYASKDVANLLAWLQNNGAVCVGQSSWGPTGFAILQNQQQAEDLQNQAQLAFAAKPNISFQICRGKNTGAEIISE